MSVASSPSNTSAQSATTVASDSAAAASSSTTASSSSIKYSKTSAGTGDPAGLGATNTNFSTRGPVTWPALGLVSVVAACAVAYYKIERERRLENAMGKIVSLIQEFSHFTMLLVSFNFMLLPSSTILGFQQSLNVDIRYQVS